MSTLKSDLVKVSELLADAYSLLVERRDYCSDGEAVIPLYNKALQALSLAQEALYPVAEEEGLDEDDLR